MVRKSVQGRKVLAILLSAVLLLAVFPLTALAEPAEIASGTFQNYTTTWRVTDDGVLTIGGTGDMPNLGWDSYYPYWQYRSQITSVVFEEGVTSVGNYAFYNGNNNWNSLTSVTFADSITSINYYAFCYCRNLSCNLSLPDNLTKIESYAFDHCTNIKGNLSIPEGITFISDYAFNECNSLNGSLSLPEGLTTIGNCAFYNCSKLTGPVTIPSTLTNVYSSAFYGCTEFTAVYCDTLEHWFNINFFSTTSNPLYYANNLYIGGELYGQLTLPEGRTTIGSYTFCGWKTADTTLVIPPNLTSIGSGAFSNCTGLTAVYCDTLEHWCDINFSDGAANPLNCAKILYINGDIYSTFTLPEGRTSVKQYTFYGCRSMIGPLDIPDTLQSVGYSAFGNCSALTQINCSSLEKWYSLDFANADANPLTQAKNLFIDGALFTEFTVPDTVTQIKQYCFYNYDKLTGSPDIVIQEGVTSIGQCAFYNCDNLTGALTFSGSVTSVGNSAFYDCDWLKSVTFRKNENTAVNKTIGSSAFYACDAITDVMLSDDVQSIGSSCFQNCYKLKNLTLGTEDSILTTIGDSAFYNCSILVGTPVVTDDEGNVSGGELIIPPRVTYIGYNAFQYCYAIKSLIIQKCESASLEKNIYNYAFNSCNNLTDVKIADDVKYIYYYAFSGCTQLKNLTLGTENSILSHIGYRAFYNCYNLVGEPIGTDEEGNQTGGTFYIPPRVTQINGEAFRYCSKLNGKLILPEGITTIEYNAFEGCSTLTGDLVIPDSVISLGSSAFRNCSGFDGALTIGSGLTQINSYTFYGCTGLKGELTIGPRVQYIYDYAFYNCKQLTGKLVIPASVQRVYNEAFHGVASESETSVREYYADHMNYININVFDTLDPTPDSEGYIRYSVFCKDCGQLLCQVDDPVQYVYMDEINADVDDVVIYLGNMYQLTVETGPDTATNQSVIFTSSDEDIATVSEIGVIKPTQLGTFTVTITPADGTETASKTVTVEVKCAHNELTPLAITNETMATCTTSGSYQLVVICAICGDNVLDKQPPMTTTPPLGHDYESVDAKEPTCSDVGWEAYQVCKRCGDNNYVELEALGHDLRPVAAKEPTCTEPGWAAYEACSRCDYSTKVEIEPLGHNFEVIEGTPATCTDGGLGAYIKCTRCDYQTTQSEIPQLYHNLVQHEGKAATCTEAGWEPYETCTRCDYTTYASIPALTHDLIVHEGSAATCTAAGTGAYLTCSRCDFETLPREIEKLEHDLVSYAGQAPTCTTPGWEDYVACSRCDYSTYQPIEVLGHDFEVHEGVPATCTTSGKSACVTCSRCDFSTEQIEIPPLGHNIIKHDAQAATCCDVGWNAYESCTRCDYTTYEEIDPIGHSFGEWVVVKKPTASQNGLELRYCCRSDAIEERVLEPVGGDGNIEIPTSIYSTNLFKNLVAFLKSIIRSIKLTSEK